MRSRVWKVTAMIVFAMTFAVLIATPARPLWPAQTILSKAVANRPHSRAFSRALSVYQVYAARPDPLAEMRRKLPSGLARLGFMGTADDIDISLWQPLGSRRVDHVLPTDSAEDVRARGLEYIVVSGFHLREQGMELDDWLKAVRGEIVETIRARQKVSEGFQPWYLVRLV